MKKYFGSWDNYEGMRDSWLDSKWDRKTGTSKLDPIPENFPTDDEVIFASYGGGAYEGDATLIWKHDGKLFECHGLHCSCYGLEGQFEPEETSVEALAMRDKKEANKHYWFLYDHDDEARVAYWALVESLLAGVENVQIN